MTVTTKIDERIERVTQAKISSILSQELSQDDFFWMRHEVAEDYLRTQLMPPMEKKKLRKDSVFWNWFRQQWHYHNLILINSYDQTVKPKPLSSQVYQEFQLERFNTHNINRAVLIAASTNQNLHESK